MGPTVRAGAVVLTFVAGGLLGACDRSSAPAGGAPGIAASGSGTAPSTSADAAPGRAPATPPTITLKPVPLARRCGPYACATFPDLAATMTALLADPPTVLAVGEAHASKAGAASMSANARFRSQALPLLKGRARDLLLELWIADKRCEDTAKQVAKRQQAVTRSQASRTPTEFEQLGLEAKRLGITPHPLDPDCDAYTKILKAGNDDVLTMLEAIRDHTLRQAGDLLRHGQSPKVAKAPLGPSLVAYGGALHNDLRPKAVMASLSFGPDLARLVGGRYLAVDLIVPELITDRPPWSALPWVPHVDRESPQVQLLRLHPGEYVMVLKAGVMAATAAPAPSAR